MEAGENVGISSTSSMSKDLFKAVVKKKKNMHKLIPAIFPSYLVGGLLCNSSSNGVTMLEISFILAANKLFSGTAKRES